MDLPVSLDRSSPVSLQRQLTDQLRTAILDGRLPAGTRMASTRSLARTAGVSRNVAVAAYDELYAEGYVEGRHGSGTFVTIDLPALPKRTRPEPVGAPRWLKPWSLEHETVEAESVNVIEFKLGRPFTGIISPDAWRRAWGDVASKAPPAYYGNPAGDQALRAAISDYLGRSRGVACGIEDIVVTSGALQALDLVARATLQPGDLVALEEPGYASARRVLAARGARIIPIAVDRDGLVVDDLPEGTTAPLLVYTTPSHQYPLGDRLSIARRLALLEWAEQSDGLIVEDDYDSEFRFDAPPLPALAGLDNAGRVVYVGTFSKVLSPSLRVGYVVAPPRLRERIVWLKRLSDYHTPWPVQRALASFMESGDLDRHIRRARRHYAEKRRIVTEEFQPVAHVAQLRGLDAGLHVFVELDPTIEAAEVVRLARSRGVVVETVHEHYQGPVTLNGLLLGYGGLEIAQLVEGTRVLASIIAHLPAATRRAEPANVS